MDPSGHTQEQTPHPVKVPSKTSTVFGKDDQGVKRTCLSTAAAVSTFLLINHWDGNRYGYCLFYVRFQEKMSVGFFHVAVDELDPLQGYSHVRYDRSFPGSTPSARHGDNHIFCPTHSNRVDSMLERNLGFRDSNLREIPAMWKWRQKFNGPDPLRSLFNRSNWDVLCPSTAVGRCQQIDSCHV